MTYPKTTKDNYCMEFGREVALSYIKDFLSSPDDYYGKYDNMAAHAIRMVGHQLALNGKHWRYYKNVTNETEAYTPQQMNFARDAAKEVFDQMRTFGQMAVAGKISV